MQKQWEFLMFLERETIPEKEWFPEKGIVSWISAKTVEIKANPAYPRQGTIPVDRQVAKEALCGTPHPPEKLLKTLGKMKGSHGSLLVRQGAAFLGRNGFQEKV